MRKLTVKNGGTFHVLEKGETANPNGRPKKLINALRADGYKLCQIVDCMTNMLALSKRELEKIWKDENETYTILEQTIASALLKSRAAGRLDSVSSLLDRAFGQPTKLVQDVTPEQPLFTEIKKNVSEDNGDK